MMPRVTKPYQGGSYGPVHNEPDYSEMDDPGFAQSAHKFLIDCGLTPTPDAVEQLSGPFLHCLRIMCERGYEPHGQLWKRSGVLGVLTDVQKKFDRFWYRTWTLGRRHDDSGYDLINFTAMCLRLEPDSRFGEWGEPAREDNDAS